MKYDYDLIVIGGGSAGLSLASVSARLGVKVALIDKENLGGDCLHYGCVPSKTLIHSAKVAHLARTADHYGVQVPSVDIDFEIVMSRINSVIQTIADHVDNADRFRGLGCDVWTETEATFIDDHTVDVGDKHISGKKIAICAGTRPRVLDLDGFSEAGYLTNESFFSQKTQPKSLLVIGSGPIGCELAQAMQRLGTHVTLVNRSDTILSKEDEDVQQFVRGVLEEEGVKIVTGMQMQSVSKSGDMKVLNYEKDGSTHTVEAQEILVAVGRTSNADQLSIEKAGVKLDKRGFIQVDAKLRTNKRCIYAAGDIAGLPQFTHAAGYGAGIIVSNAILHLPKKFDEGSIPWTTFTDPEVASCGINESMAKKKGISYTVSKFSFDHQDRALAESENRGFIKLIIGKRDKLLGVQIVGPHAGELIAEWIVALEKGIKLSDISRMVHVYPTLAGANAQAAGEYIGKKFFTSKVRTILRLIFGYRNCALDE